MAEELARGDVRPALRDVDAGRRGAAEDRVLRRGGKGPFEHQALDFLAEGPCARVVLQQTTVEARPAVGETGAVDFFTRSDLTGRLRGLVILLDEKIATDHVRVADELIDASEFGLALEVLADWLSEDETPLSDELRADFDRLATQLGNHERVMTPLALCPVERQMPDNGRPASHG
jgi:hypothetical protein